MSVMLSLHYHVLRKITEDGHESQMSTNYLGHFLLTHLLMPALTKTAADPKTGGVRIVNVSSCAHYFGEKYVDGVTLNIKINKKQILCSVTSLYNVHEK